MSFYGRSFYGKPVPQGAENMGKPWKEDELRELLKEIEGKTSIEDIAKIHKRTVGGINSRLKDIAANYFINESKQINEIVILTGLSKDEIIDAINRRENKDEKKQKKNKSVPANSVPAKSESSELQEILTVLKTIEKRVNEYIKEKSLFGE